jgi:hypothetical protein
MAGAKLPPKAPTQLKTGVANASAASKSGAKRLSTSLTNKTVTTTTKAGTLTYTLPIIAGATATVAIKPKPITAPAVDNPGKISPVGCVFNLPPHLWSLPVRPQTVAGTDFVGSTMDTDAMHKQRRGRLWQFVQNDATDAATTTATTGAGKNPKNSLYAFQFLWNPESINFSMQRNQENVPSEADSLKVVGGAFPSQESISFTIVLDRTNDFACLKAQQGTMQFKSGYTWKKANEYYATGYDSGAPKNINGQIDELMKLGTNADLEYLFKAINGQVDSSIYKNKLGKVTADIGYLIPNLMAIQLGPNNADSMSYIGWVDSVSWSHSKFTEEYIPLTTTVQISFMCFVGSTLVSKPK